MAEINTKQIVQKWKEELKLEVTGLKEKGIFPKLTIIQDSQTKEECSRYKKGKYSCAKELGIECEDVIIETEGKSKSLILRDLRDTIGDIDNPVIVQMPFTGIDIKDLNGIIPYEYDVDGFTMEQKYLLDINDPKALVPCTAKGVMKLLEELYEEELGGLMICIVNRSDLIGKPLFKLALQRDMTPIMCHSKTNDFDLNRLMVTSEIVVTGCGKRAIFNSDNVSSYWGTIIDCSMYKGEDGKVGDFDKEDILKHSYVNIASGYNHIGTTTVVALMENVVKVYKNMLAGV